MVKFALQIQADMENIERLYVDPDEFNWFIGLTCTSCREDTGKVHYISLSTPVPNRTGHGTVHYTSKCKFCSKENTVEIQRDSIHGYEKGQRASSVMIFDCRGVEPNKFEFQADWIAKSECSSRVFKDVDLREGEWVEYDELANQPVCITNCEYKFVRL